MNYFNHVGQTTPQSRSHLGWVLGFLVLVSAVGEARDVVHGAPVTLVFDAQVTNVFSSPSTNIELPFEISTGDTIQGRFTFEPSPIGQPGHQDLGIQFQIGDATLQSPTYDILIGLNQLPPVVLSDVDPVGLQPFDMITVGCSLSGAGSQCSPGTIPGAADIEWRPFVSLTGASPILVGYDLVADPEVWNLFTGRSLELRFTPVSSTGIVRADAVIGAIAAIPEPPSWLFVIVGIMTLALSRSPTVCVSFR